MKSKILVFALVSVVSAVSAAAELKLALGFLESLKSCRQGDADACELHERIKQYNDLAADCNKEVDGWFFDKALKDVPSCVEAQALLKKGDIKLAKDEN